MIQIKELTEKDIPLVHELSREVFGESALAEKYSIEKWREHLQESGLLLGAFEDGELIGFKFGYRREPERFHSWLEGVRPDSRRRGVMRALTKTQESWVKARGFQRLTVNTYAEKFPGMYAFLLGSGYRVIATEGRKSFFQKDLV